MKKENIKTQKGNIEIRKTEHKENFVILATYHLQDNRLTLAEKGFLTMLLALPNNWKISKSATSKFFNMSRNTFKTYIKALENYGYIEIEKINNNNESYLIKEISDYQINFNIYNIKSYTQKQLEFFLNNHLLNQKEINIVKKYINKIKEFEEDFKKLLEEYDNEQF
jgi:DNA-binding Lrp family transcriptional regulator